MGLLADIGQSLVDFGRCIWESLKVVWNLIKKIVSELVSWTVSIAGWFLDLAEEIVELIVTGVVAAFIWILGKIEGAPEQDESENQLLASINERLSDPNHEKVRIIKGLINKKTGKLESHTELESASSISLDVLQNTGNKRFAELVY